MNFRKRLYAQWRNSHKSHETLRGEPGKNAFVRD